MGQIWIRSISTAGSKTIELLSSIKLITDTGGVRTNVIDENMQGLLTHWVYGMEVNVGDT